MTQAEMVKTANPQVVQKAVASTGQRRVQIDERQQADRDAGQVERRQQAVRHGQRRQRALAEAGPPEERHGKGVESGHRVKLREQPAGVAAAAFLIGPHTSRKYGRKCWKNTRPSACSGRMPVHKMMPGSG